MKITINGETFDYDMGSRLMSEALAIERVWGRRYEEFRQEVNAGSAEAWAVLAWAVWRRNGREVPLQDILDGKVDFDLTEMVISVNAGYAEEAQAAGDPTSGASPLTGPDGMDTTSPATSGRSRPSSASGPGKSAS